MRLRGLALALALALGLGAWGVLVRGMGGAGGMPRSAGLPGPGRSCLGLLRSLLAERKVMMHEARATSVAWPVSLAAAMPCQRLCCGDDNACLGTGCAADALCSSG